MMKYAYFPGCSLHSTGLEYDLSTRAVLRYLSLELVELSDWNCCGASSAHALDRDLGLNLPARNLAMAQQVGGDLITPCAACYNRMKTADYMLRTDPEKRYQIESRVGFRFSGEVSIRPVLAVLYEDCGMAALRNRAVRMLSGLPVVPYYGCLLVRPPEIVQFDDPDDPQIMSALLRSVDVEVLNWSYATDCCGGSLSLSRADIVRRLVQKLVDRAREAGAKAIVTACPLCMVNLEMRQSSQPGLPVFYFTELLGLAFDLEGCEQWWRKHLIDPRPLLRQYGFAK